MYTDFTCHNDHNDHHITYQYVRVYVQFHTSAVNMALPTFASEHRAAVPLQKNRSSGRRMTEYEGQTDGCPTVA